MVARHNTPNQKMIRIATAAFFAMAAIFTAPALATTTSAIPCIEATLDVPVNVLAANVVNHEIPASPIAEGDSIDDFETVSSARLLVPRAEAAIRNAFKESERAIRISASAEITKAVLAPPMAGTDSQSKSTTAGENQGQPSTRMNTRLPGVSDEALSHYKKQMYRRDI